MRRILEKASHNGQWHVWPEQVFRPLGVAEQVYTVEAFEDKIEIHFPQGVVLGVALVIAKIPFR